MRTGARLAAAMLASGVLLTTGCGGEPRASADAPPPEVVQAMTVPESPYYIIYHPPVDLAKRPESSRR